jgi:hypothetical protein
MTGDSEADRIARLADELEDMSREQGAAAIDALSPEDRAALQALVMHERLRWAAEADLLKVLDDGRDVFDDLSKATPPTGLLAVIKLMVEDDPPAAIAALFAAVVLSSEPGDETPPAIRELYEQWHRRATPGTDHQDGGA